VHGGSHGSLEALEAGTDRAIVVEWIEEVKLARKAAEIAAVLEASLTVGGVEPQPLRRTVREADWRARRGILGRG
jgi:hypothetical protein